MDPSKGKVYYLNFKPEAADQWKEVAEKYTKETGVQVTVETGLRHVRADPEIRNGQGSGADPLPSQRSGRLRPLEGVLR